MQIRLLPFGVALLSDGGRQHHALSFHFISRPSS
jgi:hypothetical protein